ncbi:hypothetical protein [Achromobacter sp. Bel]|uniref:hypothetical protein n=1 Tax=Achromobacter sp. Bel TaxID=2727415 RepID=UPI00145F165A|nr:hypothetical protein [Achromobacter sp. Bel]NMK46315.1 hypothetical protein [Achromobacter sp. Bel]
MNGSDVPRELGRMEVSSPRDAHINADAPGSNLKGRATISKTNHPAVNSGWCLLDALASGQKWLGVRFAPHELSDGLLVY